MKTKLEWDKIIVGIIIVCAIYLFFSSTEPWIQNIKFIILNNFILFLGGIVLVTYLLKQQNII